MENIIDVSYKIIRKLILESEWGQSVTNNELLSFLFNEFYELVEGCNGDDKDNMLEEASDVLMILLYIVIKNVDNQQDNQIEELLRRLNKKLLTRYSVFFEGSRDAELEEQHWQQTKHIEKEFLHYLYCPMPHCPDFAKANRGNMIIEGSQVKCQSCGYTDKCSGKNIILYTNKYRRKLLDTLDNHYVGYLKGSDFYADEYFSGYHDDYMKVLRYWAGNKIGSLALKNYFTSKHNASEESFEEFLIHPLRNYLQEAKGYQRKLTRSVIEMNDIIVKCINMKYIETKSKFCKINDMGYHQLWLEYVRTLLMTMVIPVEYEVDSFGNKSMLVELSKEDNDQAQQGTINVLKIAMEQKTAKILNQLIIGDKKENGMVLHTNILACKNIIQVGQLLVSVVYKFNLQYTQKLQCELYNCYERIDRQDLSQFLRDLFPIMESIEYV